MAELSDRDTQIIAKYSIGEALDPFRINFLRGYHQLHIQNDLSQPYGLRPLSPREKKNPKLRNRQNLQMWRPNYCRIEFKDAIKTTKTPYKKLIDLIQTSYTGDLCDRHETMLADRLGMDVSDPKVLKGRLNPLGKDKAFALANSSS